MSGGLLFGGNAHRSETAIKGIIFNLLEEIIVEEYGDDGWDLSLHRAGLEGGYTALGSYPDSEVERLTRAGSELLGMEPEEIVRWFGRNAIPRLYERFPGLFDPHTSTIPFLLTLNDIIHPEVRKLYPGAQVPVFDYTETGDHRVVMDYTSQRGLCALGEGLIEGAGDHYGDELAVRQPACAKRGDDHCTYEVTVGR